MNVTPFFALDETLRALRMFSKALDDPNLEPPEHPNVLPQLKQIIRVLISNAEKFDELCPTNIQWIGKRFLEEISLYNHEPTNPNITDKLIQIFILAYRFVCELELSITDELSFELRKVKEFVEQNLMAFPEHERSHLVYTQYLMPASIAKNLLHHPNVVDARSFAQSLESAATYKSEWEKDFAEKREELTAIRAELNRFSSAFNFVGLVDGFMELSRKKSREKDVAFFSLLFLGALVLAPVALEIGFVLLNISEIEEHKATLLYTLPALITLEVILVYFFRVVLAQFRSLKAQLLQLDLRTALCQFIQSYADYAGKIKKQDASALEKFESLIFSGLLSNEESLPSTFDGTEQLAKLVKSMRGQ